MSPTSCSNSVIFSRFLRANKNSEELQRSYVKLKKQLTLVNGSKQIILHHIDKLYVSPLPTNQTTLAY